MAQKQKIRKNKIKTE